MHSSMKISAWTVFAASLRKTALLSTRFAPWRPALRTFSSNSPTSRNPFWRPPVTNVFRGCGAVFYKEVLHVRRDFATLFFSLIIPILQMLLLGYGIDTNIRQINTVVFNADGRQESRELLDRLKNSDTFHVVRYVDSDQQMNDMIIAGKAHVGIKIPVDYSDKLLHKMNATTFLTAFSIVREKERGTLEQLFVTPVRPMGLLLGKLLPYLGIGFFELCMILTFMRFAFHVPIHGSVFLLAFLSLPYIFVSLSLGILISGKAHTQSEAIHLSFVT